jgi:hypothetical protein
MKNLIPILLTSIILYCATTEEQKKPYKTFTVPQNSKGIQLAELTDNKDSSRWAILVGINYDQNPALNNIKLSKARQDAIELGKMLKDKGQFQVVTLTDERRNEMSPHDPNYPTARNIKSGIADIVDKADVDDTVIIFFSGHGISDEAGNNYLIPADVDMKNNQSKFESSVKVEDIVQQLNKKGLKKTLLLLDACRERGATRDSGKSLVDFKFQIKQYADSSVAASYFCTSEDRLCYEHPESDNGVFTHYLLKGLRNEGDQNKDTIVTFSELSDFVGKSMKDWSALHPNMFQKPTVRYNKADVSGDIVLTMTTLVENKYRAILQYVQGDLKIADRKIINGQFVNPSEKIILKAGSTAIFQIYPFSEAINFTVSKDSELFFREANNKLTFYITQGEIDIYAKKMSALKEIYVVTSNSVLSVVAEETHFNVKASRTGDVEWKVLQGSASLRLAMPHNLEFQTDEVLKKTGLDQILKNKFLPDSNTLKEKAKVSDKTRDKAVSGKYKLGELFRKPELINLGKSNQPDEDLIQKVKTIAKDY